MQVYDISTLLDHLPSTILPMRKEKEKKHCPVNVLAWGYPLTLSLDEYVDGGMKRKYEHRMLDGKGLASGDGVGSRMLGTCCCMVAAAGLCKA
jgi:hypothetical protein